MTYAPTGPPSWPTPGRSWPTPASPGSTSTRPRRPPACSGCSPTPTSPRWAKADWPPTCCPCSPAPCGARSWPMVSSGMSASPWWRWWPRPRPRPPTRWSWWPSTTTTCRWWWTPRPRPPMRSCCSPATAPTWCSGCSPTRRPTSRAVRWWSRSASSTSASPPHRSSHARGPPGGPTTVAWSTTRHARGPIRPAMSWPRSTTSSPTRSGWWSRTSAAGSGPSRGCTRRS